MDYKDKLKGWHNFLRSSEGKSILDHMDNHIESLTQDLIKENDESKRALIKAYQSIKNEALFYKGQILDKQAKN